MARRASRVRPVAHELNTRWRRSDLKPALDRRITTIPRLLLTPTTVGVLRLPNRMVMAPMTRNRAGAGNVPTPLMATYYRQRASAGLIVTEATQVAPEGRGDSDTHDITPSEQVDRETTVA